MISNSLQDMHKGQLHLSAKKPKHDRAQSRLLQKIRRMIVSLLKLYLQLVNGI